MGAVWKPPAEKHNHITAVNTTSASVTTLAAATPTTCLRAVTLRWIQSSSHVKQPHPRSASARRRLQRAVIVSVHDHVTEFHLEHFCKLRGNRRCRLNCCETHCIWIIGEKEQHPERIYPTLKESVWKDLSYTCIV